MQKVVRNAGAVLDWMNGTRQLIETDDPRFKATATRAFDLKTPADWTALKGNLLTQLDASAQNAQNQAHQTIDTHGSLSAQPFLPADKFGAVFQSAMVEHLNDKMASTAQAQTGAVAVPDGSPEKFDVTDGGWVIMIVARLEQAMEGKATFIRHSDVTNFRYVLPEKTRVALFADWATGEPPALAIKSAIEKQTPEYTIHLGDTYYAGFAHEIRRNLVACWPGTVQYQKSFAMNGNHEMYCGGHAYFDSLPTFGQSASYFNIGNKYWRLIALDTSWCERNGNIPASSWGELADIQLEWLDAQIQHAKSYTPKAKIILLTHHQMFSAFEGDDLGQHLRLQLKSYLDKKDFYAWFWGHEHRGIVYAPNSLYNFKARCIGHGSFPYPPCTNLPTFAAQFPITWHENRCEPGNAWYGMRGFAMFIFSGSTLTINYVDQLGQTAFSENL